MRTKSDAACVIQRRPRCRTPSETQRTRRHRFSINGHFYNHKVTSRPPSAQALTLTTEPASSIAKPWARLATSELSLSPPWDGGRTVWRNRVRASPESHQNYIPVHDPKAMFSPPQTHCPSILTCCVDVGKSVFGLCRSWLGNVL